MKTRRVGSWTLGIALVAAGAALLYQELTGTAVALLRYWPLALVGLGAEMLFAQAAASRAGDTRRIRISGLAIAGLIILLAVGPAGGDGWGVNCGPVAPSCHDGGWATGVEHKLPAEDLNIDWPGVDEVWVTVRFGAITVRAITAAEQPGVSAQITGHAGTAAAARAIAEAASVQVERMGGRLELTGTYTKPGGIGSEYASINLTIRLPAETALVINDEYGPVDVQGMLARVEVKTRMAEISIRDAGEVEATSDHGRIEVRRTRGPAAVTSTYGAVSVEDTSGPLTVESKHGAIDVRGPGGSVTLTATYGAITLRYRNPPAGPAFISNKYGAISVEHPAGSSYELDAVAERSRISSNLAGVTISTVGSGSRAQATVGGGGPVINIRNDYGRVDIRSF